MILGIAPIVSIEIQNPFNKKDFRADKLTILNIKARDQAGRILHVETLDSDVLPEPLKEPAYQHAAKELEMLTQDALLRGSAFWGQVLRKPGGITFRCAVPLR